jgi:hypothetical protein
MSDQSPSTGAMPPPPLTPQQVQQRQLQLTMTQALRGGAPLIYGNQVSIAQTSSDLTLVVIANGNPAATISMSYITAKSLARDLAQAIGVFESAYGAQVKTINEINPEMEKKMREAQAHAVR